MLMAGYRKNINERKSRTVALIKEQGRRSRLAYRKCWQSGLGTGWDVRVTRVVESSNWRYGSPSSVPGTELTRWAHFHKVTGRLDYSSTVGYFVFSLSLNNFIPSTILCVSTLLNLIQRMHILSIYVSSKEDNRFSLNSKDELSSIVWL